MSGSIVILTGAGISRASGLETFSGDGGIWNTHEVDKIASAEALAKNPTQVLSFYDDMRKKLLSDEVSPNAAHYALARLEVEWAGQVIIITQNIDNLHERAGNTHVIHSHGELTKARCTSCGHVFSWWRDIDTNDLCGVCGEDAPLRPHIVLFGESPLELGKTEDALGHCDLFVSIGSSLTVHPAAGFVDAVNSRDNTLTVELNQEPSARSEVFDEGYFGAAEEIVPIFVSGLLAVA